MTHLREDDPPDRRTDERSPHEPPAVEPPFVSEPDPEIGYGGVGEIRLRGRGRRQGWHGDTDPEIESRAEIDSRIESDSRVEDASRPELNAGASGSPDRPTGADASAGIGTSADASLAGWRARSGGWFSRIPWGRDPERSIPLPGARGLRLLAGGLAFVIVLAIILATVRHRTQTGGPDAGPGGPGTISFTLYFLDDEGALVAEAREMAAKASPVGQLQAVVSEQLGGSMSGGENPIPKGTKLLHLFVSRDGLVTMDLSREIMRDHHRDMESEFATLSTLVRIVRDNFPELTGVQILVEGEPVPTLAGHFAIDGPLLGEEWR